MTEEEIKRLERGKDLVAKIYKTKAQIEAVKSCVTVTISKPTDKRIDFNIDRTHPFYNEATSFIEKFSEHLKQKLAALEKEFNAL